MNDHKKCKSSECAFCANPNGLDPIEAMIAKNGMAIVSLTDEDAPPLCYSVGISGPNGNGIEFIMAGLNQEIASEVIGNCCRLYKSKPELFTKSVIPKACKITLTNGKFISAPVLVRPITDDIYESACGRLIDRYQKRVRVLHVIIPDANGRLYGHHQYDHDLANAQCLFISEPSPI